MATERLDFPTDTVRASDAEREQAATALRDHTAAGRLTVDELAERLQAAFAAQTRKDLHDLFEDLPLRIGPDRAHGDHVKARAHRAHVRAYLLFCVAMVALWAVTGLGYFWPIWPIMGWGIGVASHTAACWPRRARGIGAGTGRRRPGLRPPALG